MVIAEGAGDQGRDLARVLRPATASGRAAELGRAVMITSVRPASIMAEMRTHEIGDTLSGSGRPRPLRISH